MQIEVIGVVWHYRIALLQRSSGSFWKQEYKLLRHLILPGFTEMWWQVLIWSVIYQPSCSSQKGSPRKAVKGPLIYEQWRQDSWRTEENYWPYKHGQEVSTPPNKWQKLPIPNDTSRVKKRTPLAVVLAFIGRGREQFKGWFMLREL